MQRQELEKLGWTTRGLSYLEKRLQAERTARVDGRPCPGPLKRGHAPLSHATGFIGNL